MAGGRYRTVFQAHMAPDAAYSVASAELRAWLRQKKLDVQAFDERRMQVGPREILLSSTYDGPDGTHTYQWQLRERRDRSHWLTSLVVHAEGGRHEHGRSGSAAGRPIWFWVDVESVPSKAAPVAPTPPPAVPRLVRNLLTVVDGLDHWALLRAEPILVRPGAQVEELLHVLSDDERRLPVVIASPHRTVPFETWRQTVRRATRSLVGLASLYILDPPALEQLNAELGPPYAVWGGAIRTYLPGLDLAVDDHAMRHRVMSAARLQADPRQAERILAGLPRARSAYGQLPRPLARLSRAAIADLRGVTGATAPLDRLYEHPRVQSPAGRSAAHSRAAQPAPAGVTDPARVERLRARVEALEAENTELRAEHDLVLKLAEDVDDERRQGNAKVAELQAELEDLAQDVDLKNRRLVELTDQVRALRRRLTDLGRAQEAYEPVDDPTPVPDSLLDVLDFASKLSRVAFVGDLGVVLKLEEKAGSPSWAHTAWQAMQTMQAYAEAAATGDTRAGFKQWCANPPPGAGFDLSPGKVKVNESETVRSNAAMRRLRVFNVPPEVHPDGRVFMGAHVRLGGGAGMSEPRLHFYDDTAGTGKVYVGYIGPHLPVAGSN